MSLQKLEVSPISHKKKDNSAYISATLRNSLSDIIYNKEEFLKKKPKNMPKKLETINAVLPEHKRQNSTSKQITVNQLVSRPELETLKTERTPDNIMKINEKWNTIQMKTDDLISKISMNKIQQLKTSIEDSYFLCSNNTNLSEISKLSVLDYFLSIFSTFRSACYEILAQKSQFKTENDLLRQENLKLKDDFSVFQEKLAQRNLTKSPSLKPIPQVQSQEKVKSMLELENAKLTEKISILEAHLETLTSQSRIENLMAEVEKFKTLSEKWKIKNDKLTQKLKILSYKYQCELGEVKVKAKEDQEFVRKFYDISSNYQSTIESLETENKKLKDSKNMSYERLSMLYEDYTSMKDYKENYKKLQEYSNSLKHKYNQLEIEFIAGTSQRRSDDKYWVTFNGPLFERLKDFVPFPDLKDPSVCPDTNTYRLSSPSFAGLLDLQDDKFSFEPQYPNWLEVHIRGIYDSKYIEHLLCTGETGKQPSRFPDFVYNWLGKFCIDDKTRQVSEIEWWKKESIETFRVKFLSALKLANTQKIWELYTFQEFLNEDLMIDELAFYLHCRNLMFKGPQLQTTQGKFACLNFIEQEHLNSVVDSVLHKLGQTERLEIKMQIGTKAKVFSGGYSLEVGFVLRLLLEFYVREKKSKFLGLSNSFLTAPMGRFGGISFKAFQSLCAGLYPEVTDLMVIRIYKLAWVISKGMINCHSFLVAAQECGFFYFALQLRGNYRPLKLNENQEIVDLKENLAGLQVYSIYLRHKQEISMVKEIAKGFGVSEICDNLNRLDDLMQRKLQEPLEFYNGLDLGDVFLRLWKMIVQIMTVFQETYMNYLGNHKNIEEITLGTKTFFESIQDILVNRVSTKVAIRKIQKIWKQKARKAVAMTATVVKSITMFKRKIKK